MKRYLNRAQRSSRFVIQLLVEIIFSKMKHGNKIAAKFQVSRYIPCYFRYTDEHTDTEAQIEQILCGQASSA